MTDLTDGAPRKRTNAAKVRLVAADRRRPGAECKAPAGAFVPIVNRGKCEAEGDCVEVCPYDVSSRTDRREGLSRPWLVRTRARVHGMRTSLFASDPAYGRVDLPYGSFQILPAANRRRMAVSRSRM